MKIAKIILICLSLSAAAIAPVSVSYAQNQDPFSTINTLSQEEFNQLAESVSAANAFRGNTPGYPLGLTGFELQANAHFAQLGASNEALYNKANQNRSGLPGGLASGTALQLDKGLPFDVDVGIGLARTAGFTTMNANARYALLAGNLILPNIALRAAYTKSYGNDFLGLNAKSIDISITKGILFLEPYAGVGRVYSNVSAPKFSGDFAQNRFFAGLNFKFPLLATGYEFDKTGSTTVHTLKFALKW